MQIFGYTISRAGCDAHPPFDDLAQPLFRRGGKVGCIVLHGIGGTPANVRVTADALIAAGYTVDIPLLPGHGETVRELGRSTEAQWLQAALLAYDRLKKGGCTEIIPIGLSLGGILAALIAANRPCKGVVLIAPPIRMRAWLHIARLCSAAFPFVDYSTLQCDRMDNNLPYSQMYSGFSTRALRPLHQLSRRLRHALSDITCPVLAIWPGRDGKVHPKSAEILRRGLKNAPLTEQHLPDAIHGCSYAATHRDAVAESVADFIAALPPKA